MNDMFPKTAKKSGTNVTFDLWFEDFLALQPQFLTDFYTFWSYDPRRVRRVSHTTTRQLSSPEASEVASSEVSAIAEVKFAPTTAQVNNSLGQT